MKSVRLSLILCFFLILMTLGSASAQGTTGAQFLGIGMGARSMGMGGAFVSLATDGSALYWNPAGLALTRANELTVSHVSWIEDVGYQYAGYAAPFGERGALGLAFERGAVESWDNTGDGDFSAGDFYGVVGYGRRFGARMGVGGSIKYLSSSLGDASASSYALDLGLIYRFTEKVSFGAVARNIGPGLAFEREDDPLPALFAIGASYSWPRLTLSADIEKQSDLAMVTRLGAEYRPMDLISLRTGAVMADDSQLSSFTGGVGLNWNDTWGLDYAYRPTEVGAAHWFALSARFGGVGAEPIMGATPPTAEIGESAVPKSNLTVITELVRETVSEAVDKMGLTERSQLYMSQADQHQGSWLVESIFLEELTGRGHVVMVGSMPAGVEEHEWPTYEITYRIVSLGTTYPRAWREWVIGQRKVERRSEVDLHFQLSDIDGAVVWAGQADGERRDIVAGSRIGDLSSPGQPFTSPELESGGWDKVLEPLVVAAIVGGLIYLFYTSETTQ